MRLLNGSLHEASWLVSAAASRLGPAVADVGMLSEAAPKRHRPGGVSGSLRFLVLLLLGWFVTVAGAAAAERPAPYGFTFTAIEGNKLDLETFRGKTLLVVNTASLCGFTYQYTALQKLWERYRDRGLVVLGVPSNDFGHQEPGSNTEIKEFCEANFDVDFPMTEKVVVQSKEAHPLFAWFKQQLGEAGEPRWNFHKYLIGPDGRLIKSWGSTTEPESRAILDQIEAHLPPRA